MYSTANRYAINENKTISANSRGVIICYGDANKHKFIGYETNGSDRKFSPLRGAKYQELEKPVFNRVQYKLYHQALHGFDAYDKSEIQRMSKIELNKIMTKYTKAHRILNTWKQEIISTKVNHFLSTRFAHSKLAKVLIETNGYNPDVKESISFKDLGIPVQAIATKLVESKVLPLNFFEIEDNERNLSIMGL